jgi:hypothetical protein
MIIKNSALKRGITMYEKAIWKFIGNSFISRLKRKNNFNWEEVQELLKKETPMGSNCRWLDIAGMICPSDAVEQLLHAIENDQIHSLEEINTSLRTMHSNYYTYEWSWAADVLEQFYGKAIRDFTVNDMIEIVRRWKDAVLEMDKMLYEDAKKEFSMSRQTGFGVDGDKSVQKLDFERVRGEFETHAEVKAIRDHMAVKEALGNEVIAEIEHMVQVEMIKN